MKSTIQEKAEQLFPNSFPMQTKWIENHLYLKATGRINSGGWLASDGVFQHGYKHSKFNKINVVSCESNIIINRRLCE